MAPASASVWSDARIRKPLLCAAAAGLVLVVASIARGEITGALRDAVSVRDTLLAVSTELRHSSDALTRWSRAYVVTKDPRYRQLFGELLEVREGRRGRPQGEAPAYWNLREWADSAPDESAPRNAITDIVRSAGATPEEIALFIEALDASARLVAVESGQMQAADAAGSSPPEAILQPLFDSSYARKKAAVVLPIERFAQAVHARTAEQTRVYFRYLRSTDYAFAVSALALLWSLLVSWRGLRSMIGEPVEQFAARIRSLAPGPAAPTAGKRAADDSLSRSLQSVATELRVRDQDIQRLIGELRLEQERERLLIENAPVAIALFDAQMRYLAWSERWVLDYGLAGRELSGRSHYEIFPEISEAWRAAYRRGLAGESLRTDEDRFERPDGQVQILRWQIVPWRDHDGSVGGIIIMSEDVTQAVLQREELEGWARVFEEAQLGIAWIDASAPGEPRIVDANPYLARMLGVAREALCGRPVMSMVPEDMQDVMRSIVPELDSKGHVSVESALLAHDGRRIPVLLDITHRPGDDPVKRRRIAFVLELLERYRLLAERDESLARLHATNEQLRRARDEAAAASVTRNAILANMSHELRTPLNHILGFAHLLESSPLDADALHRVQRIRNAGSTLLRLVNNLLDAVRVETGTIEIQDQDVNLAALLDAMTIDLEPLLKAQGRRIQTELPADIPARLRTDPRRLTQALRELLDNAIKFSSHGAVVLRASRRVAEDGGSRLRIEVEDQGVGVSPEQQRRLFSWFVQGDDSATRSFGGVGMGLVLAQRIIALMEGSIGYRPTPGGGSTFWLELPLRGPLSPDSATAAPDPAATRIWLAEWLPLLRAQDMAAVSHWTARPDAVNASLGRRAELLETAMRDFDFEIACALAEDALAALSTPA